MPARLIEPELNEVRMGCQARHALEQPDQLKDVQVGDSRQFLESQLIATVRLNDCSNLAESCAIIRAAVE